MISGKKILLALIFIGNIFAFSAEISSAATTYNPTCTQGGDFLYTVSPPLKECRTSPGACVTFTDKTIPLTPGARIILTEYAFATKPGTRLGAIRITSLNNGVTTVHDQFDGNAIGPVSPGADITSWFNDGYGDYTVQVYSEDTDGDSTSCGAGIILTLIPPPPSCTLSSDRPGVFPGETSSLSWTAANAASALISGIGTLTADEIAAGRGNKSTPPITGTVNYTMSIVGLDGSSASCGPVTIGILTPPTGGLIPCGRLVNAPPPPGETTDLIDESKPCSLCTVFYMLKNIINFVTTLSIGIGVFVLILSGLLYAVSAGDSHKIELAKTAITSTIIGLAIIFVAWLAIAVILQGMGYANIGTWNQVNCNLP